MRYEELTIEGRNAVIEAFRSGKTIDRVFILDNCQDGPIMTIKREAKKTDCLIKYVSRVFAAFFSWRVVCSIALAALMVGSPTTSAVTKKRPAARNIPNVINNPVICLPPVLDRPCQFYNKAG